MILARDLGTDVPLPDVLDARKWAAAVFWPVLETLATSPDVRQLGKTLLDSLPAAAVSHALRAGLSVVELETGLTFGLMRYAGNPEADGLRRGPDYDATYAALPFDPDARTPQGYRLQLPPQLLAVSRVRFAAFGTTFLDVDADDADTGTIDVIDAASGAVLVRPPAQSTSVVAEGWHNPLYMTSRYLVPGVIRVDFTTCPASLTGKRGHVPAALCDWVWLWAGVRVANQAGTFSTRGVTSASISVDGLSKSQSFQASAMYGVNSSMEALYKEQMKLIDLAKLGRAVRGFTVVGFGGR